MMVMEGVGEKVCPICNEPLIFVEEKREFWCHRCNEDPFRESKIHDNECAIFMFCSSCDSVLRYIPKKQDFWCWVCNKYPMFHSPKPRKGPLGSDDDPYKRSDMICFTCGRYLRFITSKKRYWCDSCREFPIMYYREGMNYHLGLETDVSTAIFRTLHNPEGLSVSPKYRVKGNEIVPFIGGPSHYKIRGSSVYSTMFAPEGRSVNPVFRIRHGKMVPTMFHKNGSSIFPWFELR